MSAAPEVSDRHLKLGAQMRRQSLRGWYVGDAESLLEFGVRGTARGVTEPELLISLLYSRDKMHHSVGWWRNAEYEYCYHLSISAKELAPIEALGELASQEDWDAVPYEQVPRAEARYWTHALFGEHVDKLWWEPGGTDPRLTREQARTHAKFWHMRLFLEPEILNQFGDPFVPFIPNGEVYELTRWIDGLTPEKVDR